MKALPAGALTTVTIGGRTFRCTARTAAHLLWTVAELARLHPGARLVVLQGCYNTTVAASKGTHDYDACVDVRIEGLDWWAAQRFLREHGWAAWFRHTGTWASPSRWHIHMISLGYPGKVGEYVDGGVSLTGRAYTSSQVADYYAHTFGLKGQHNVDLDKSWFPGDGDRPDPPVGTPALWRAAIDLTIFDYPAWVRDQEDNMPYTDWPKADRDAIAKDVAAAVVEQLLAAAVDTGVTVKQALKQAANAAGLVRKLAAALGKRV